MDQRTRNRIAAVFAIILVPTMVYLFVVNIQEAREIRHRRRPPPSSQTPVATPPSSQTPIVAPPSLPPGLPPSPPPAPAKDKAPTIQENALKEQRRIATLLPKRDPFHSPTPPEVAAPTNRVPERIVPKIEVTAIVYSKIPEKRMVVINGQTLLEGQSVEGYRIIRINNADVELDNGTSKLTVQVKR